MTNKDLIIFVLSFGRKKVPTLKHIQRKENVIVLTSEDNEYKNEIDTQGAKLMIFDKNDFKYRGLEMMNEESVPQKRSAVYAYNYAIEYGRKNGYKYVLVLDDDYFAASPVNNRGRENINVKLDIWAHHAVSFLKKYPFIGATCSINSGQLFSGAKKAYLRNLQKRQLMNTIIFNTKAKHYFHSLGNGDYCDTMVLNTYSTWVVVRLATFLLYLKNDFETCIFDKPTIGVDGEVYKCCLCKAEGGFFGAEKCPVPCVMYNSNKQGKYIKNKYGFGV